MITLYDNWQTILKKAWSIRLMLLAGLLSGCEVIVPLFADTLPRNVFAVLSGMSVMGALIARLIVQKDLPK